MLKPLVCLACEKVIISKDEIASLIGLFSKFVVTVPAGAEIPHDAVAPKDWAIYSNWDTEPGDETKAYTLCTKIVYPDKTQFGNVVKQKLPIEAGKRVQNYLNMIGFPIGQPGEHVVSTWIELNDQMVLGPFEIGVGLIVLKQEETQTYHNPRR